MKKIAMRGAAVVAAASVAAGALSAGTANADTFLRLDNPTVNQKIGDGNVSITLRGHTAKLSPGMVALPTTRNAWVSGALDVKVTGGKATGGSIQAGYAIGCQIQITTASVSASGGLQFGSVSPGGYATPDKGVFATGTTGGSIGLGAGQIGTQYLTFDRATFPKPGDEVKPTWANPKNSYGFDGNAGSLAYSDQTIGVDGCGGYAQAKFFAVVTAKVGNTEGTLVIWSKPFSLG